jgi:hypothetical protein
MSDLNAPQPCRCNSLSFNFSPCSNRRTGDRATYVRCSRIFDSGDRCPQRANNTCYLVQQNAEAAYPSPSPFLCSDCVEDIANDIIDEANQTGGNVFDINDQRKATQAAHRKPLAEILSL